MTNFRFLTAFGMTTFFLGDKSVISGGGGGAAADNNTIPCKCPRHSEWNEVERGIQNLSCTKLSDFYSY